MTVLLNKPSRDSYHSALKIAAYSNILPKHIAKSIPASTLSGWRRIPPNHYIGLEYSDFLEKIDLLKEISQSRSAMAVSSAVLRLVHLVKTLGVGFQKIAKIKKRNFVRKSWAWSDGSVIPCP